MKTVEELLRASRPMSPPPYLRTKVLAQAVAASRELPAAPILPPWVTLMFKASLSYAAALVAATLLLSYSKLEQTPVMSSHDRARLERAMTDLGLPEKQARHILRLALLTRTRHRPFNHLTALSRDAKYISANLKATTYQGE